MWISVIFLKNPVKCIPGCFLKIPGSSWLQKPWKPLGIIAIFACWHKGKRFAKIMGFYGNHWIPWNSMISIGFYENTEPTGIQNNLHLQETFIIQSKFRCFWSAGAPGGGNHINSWKCCKFHSNMLKFRSFCRITLKINISALLESTGGPRLETSIFPKEYKWFGAVLETLIRIKSQTNQGFH